MEAYLCLLDFRNGNYKVIHFPSSHYSWKTSFLLYVNPHQGYIAAATKFIKDTSGIDVLNPITGQYGRLCLISVNTEETPFEDNI